MFHAKLDKKQKILFYTPVSKFLKILTLNICDGAKQIYPKKKKKILTKDTLQISGAAIRRCTTVKKVSLKNSPPVYCYWHMLTLSVKISALLWKENQLFNIKETFT